jgi:hypothetical protein
MSIFCPLHQDTREQLRVKGRLNFGTLVTTGGKKGHKMVTEEKNPRALPARV